MNKLNQSLYRNFVCPELCRNLMIAGLDVQLPFFWKIYDHVNVLKSYHFDNEKYYEENDQRINRFNPPKGYLPAFQLMDLEPLIPDYLVNRTGLEYSIVTDKLYDSMQVTDIRLPDAFAKMVLQLICEHKISPMRAADFLIRK